MVTRWLEVDPEIKVVASYANGAVAVRQILDTQPDVLLLDIEMPEMDGMTALPLLLKAQPDLKIIMSSTLTRRNAEISLRALSMGAVDYIAKPESRYANSDDFKNELIQKIKVLAALRKARPARAPASGPAPALAPPRSYPSASPAPAGGAPLSPRPAPRPAAGATTPGPMTSGSIWGKQQIVLRAPSRARPAILAIGSSTGGPQALFKLLATLSPDLNLPVVITQHMPATFTAILAEHIQNATKRACKEAVSGEPLVSGQIYVAPGDYHMTIVAEGSNRVLRLNQEPPENFCRPAVDPMFRSIAKIYGNAALAVILTGMGTDGREGGRVLVDAGGTPVCQDEASSVVWGMPGAAATAGLAAAVVSLDQMPATISRFIKGGM
jgi:two-component system chemotaxis response regulator CheB